MTYRLVFFVLSILLLIMPISQSRADSTDMDMQYFEQIPILDNGRIKPLGTYARTTLKTLYGSEKFQGYSAVQWLAETIFNPSIAIDIKSFKIQDTDTKEILRLNLDNDTFSAIELQPALQRTQDEIIAILQNGDSADDDKDTYTQQQEALLKIHDNAALHTGLLRSLSMILPLNIAIPEKYKPALSLTDNAPITFRALLPIERRVTDDLQTIIRRKGEDINRYSTLEKSIALLGFQLQQIRSGGANNTNLKIVPEIWTEAETTQWFSPWQIIQNGKGSPQSAQYLSLWSDMAHAHRTGDANTFKSISKQALETVHTITNNKISQGRLKAELIYQSIKPYKITMALYALAAILLGASLIRKNHKPLTIKLGITALTAATIIHIAAIFARIYILDRPPVGTLYESILFVSVICAGTGIIASFKSAKALMPLIGATSALSLLAIAPVLLQKTDSLELLVAVLNTDFWLITHVLCITAGYGVCIITALLCHAYMSIRAIKGKSANKESLSKLYKSIHKSSLIALFLTAFGTALGGIWADQSWGRFWGWDPKENGALLIVLWLIWAQHARLSGHMRDLAYCACLGALNVIVALSWFGVNLLGVGLHSYGFTSGLAGGLMAFSALSLIIIAALWVAVRKREAS